MDRPHTRHGLVANPPHRRGGTSPVTERGRRRRLINNCARPRRPKIPDQTLQGVVLQFAALTGLGDASRRRLCDEARPQTPEPDPGQVQIDLEPIAPRRRLWVLRPQIAAQDRGGRGPMCRPPLPADRALPRPRQVAALARRVSIGGGQLPVAPPRGQNRAARHPTRQLRGPPPTKDG